MVRMCRASLSALVVPTKKLLLLYSRGTDAEHRGV